MVPVVGTIIPWGGTNVGEEKDRKWGVGGAQKKARYTAQMDHSKAKRKIDWQHAKRKGEPSLRIKSI